MASIDKLLSKLGAAVKNPREERVKCSIMLCKTKSHANSVCNKILRNKILSHCGQAGVLKTVMC